MYKNNVVLKKKAKKRIRKRIQKKLKGTLERPRIYVNKSNRYIYLQVIDDTKAAVLATASTLMKEFKDKNCPRCQGQHSHKLKSNTGIRYDRCSSRALQGLKEQADAKRLDYANNESSISGILSDFFPAKLPFFR